MFIGIVSSGRSSNCHRHQIVDQPQSSSSPPGSRAYDKVIPEIHRSSWEGTPDSGADSQRPILLEADGYVAHQMSLPLPPGDQIKTLQIYMIRFGSRQYVSGFRLNDNGSGLGYYHSCSSKTFRIDTSLNGSVREIACLMDYIGIRGLSIVTDRGWTAGVSPAPCPIGQLSHGVLPLGKYLTAHFDVCGPRRPPDPWQLSIELADALVSRQLNSLLWELMHHSSYRRMAVTVCFARGLPPDNVAVDLERHLYHKIRRGQYIPWNIRYNPVQYNLFSSRDSLIGITRYLGYLDMNLIGFEFHYQPVNASETEPRRVAFGASSGTPVQFLIDDPGGEYIAGLKITTMSAGLLAPILSVCFHGPVFPMSCTLLAISNALGARSLLTMLASLSPNQSRSLFLVLCQEIACGCTSGLCP
jgi:hypothetical protein